MSRVETRTRITYFAPSAGRSFLTVDAACAAEARAMIVRKYPTERQERDSIGITNRGWHWSEDERLQRLHARLRRLIRRQFKRAAA